MSKFWDLEVLIKWPGKWQCISNCALRHTRLHVLDAYNHTCRQIQETDAQSCYVIRNMEYVVDKGATNVVLFLMGTISVFFTKKNKSL